MIIPGKSAGAHLQGLNLNVFSDKVEIHGYHYIDSPMLSRPNASRPSARVRRQDPGAEIIKRRGLRAIKNRMGQIEGV